MKNITIVDKATGAATEHTLGNVSLKGTSIVKLPVGPESVQSFQQSGQNLVVTLKSGETITIQNFFVVGADGAANQLVMTNADGTLLLGNYSSPYSGFTFSEISTLDDLAAAGIVQIARYRTGYSGGLASLPWVVQWPQSAAVAVVAVAAVPVGELRRHRVQQLVYPSVPMARASSAKGNRALR